MVVPNGAAGYNLNGKEMSGPQADQSYTGRFKRCEEGNIKILFLDLLRKTSELFTMARKTFHSLFVFLASMETKWMTKATCRVIASFFYTFLSALLILKTEVLAFCSISYSLVCLWSLHWSMGTEFNGQISSIESRDSSGSDRKSRSRV